LDTHCIELYIFALDLYSNNLNHFIWKRLKVTVRGQLPVLQIPDWIMMTCQ